ncbi:MAG: glucokinase [Anaerolineae bacterium]|nr:MAG: glucokinase [Anaerolineae bacterium]
MLLAGDIGGTKTVLGLFSEEFGPHNPLAIERYPSSDFLTFEDLVSNFLAKHQAAPEAAAIGVAGPVRDNRAAGANLPWAVDKKTLTSCLDGIAVHLLNDLESIAMAVPTLQPEDIEIIKPGKQLEKGPIAIIAPGTGLGEAFLFWDGSRYRPIPSEGGHTDFAPATAEELALLGYLQKKYQHVSYERVCSGIGIPNIFDFFRETNRFPVPKWLEKALGDSEDWTPIIVDSAIAGTAEICQATLSMFLGILGSEAGNLALQILATGGVYLAGGIPPRILPQLKNDIFLNAFTRKGRLSDILWHVQINVITNPLAAIYGAASYGLWKVNSAAVV